jgi:hypothetical protein
MCFSLYLCLNGLSFGLYFVRINSTRKAVDKEITNICLVMGRLLYIQIVYYTIIARSSIYLTIRLLYGWVMAAGILTHKVISTSTSFSIHQLFFSFF